MASVSTRMTKRFKCRHPFAGAGHGLCGKHRGPCSRRLRRWRVGAVGVGFTPPDQLRAIIHHIRSTTNAPFTINFISFFDNDAQIRVCAEEKVPIASFHWGHPSHRI
jgi:NAD(P)H-dependent flavin oxidoreductase YrpB (nitropropane dioxygenase family)